MNRVVDMLALKSIKASTRSAMWLKSEVTRRNRGNLVKETQMSVLEWAIFESAHANGKVCCPECGMPIMGVECGVCHPHV